MDSIWLYYIFKVSLWHDVIKFNDMVDEADQRLFRNIRYNTHRVLHELLPPISVASQNYELRTRHTTAGPKKTPFCVLKDELFTPEDELSWADGQK